MPRTKLTSQFLKSLVTTPPGQRVEYLDTLLRGFGVRASPDHTVTYFLRRRIPGDGRLRLSVGRYPELSLSHAREKATSMAGLIAQGIDPRRPRGLLFGLLAEKYFVAAPRKKSSATVAEELRVYKRHVAPSWEERPANRIEPVDVLELLTSIYDSVIARDRRNARGSIVLFTRQLLRGIFRYGQILKVVASNPVDLVPADEFASARSQPRDRVLTDEEISVLWKLLSDQRDSAGNALQIILLSGQRPHSEIAILEWKDIEPPGDTGAWCNIVKTKNGSPNRIFLSSFALSLLPKRDGRRWVFARRGQNEPVDLKNRIRSIRPRSNIDYWTPHDLRRTAATGWARLGIEKHIIELLLNHGPCSVTDKHYIWHKYQTQIQAACVLWSDHVSALVSG
jgi:integrase